MPHANQTQAPVDVNSFVDGLDIDNELIGSTVDNDGKSVSLTEDSEKTSTTTVTVATVGATAPTMSSEDAKARAAAALELARNTPSTGARAGRDTSGSKAAKCREIFVEFYGKKTRKEVIDLYVAAGGATLKAAATYYQKDTHNPELLALVAKRDAAAKTGE